jgi:hypothetical protein
MSPSAVSENVLVAGSVGAGHASSAGNSNCGLTERGGFFRFPRNCAPTPGINRAAHSASWAFWCLGFKREEDKVQTSSNWQPLIWTPGEFAIDSIEITT